MFELMGGSIQINELAPRPHNTGHYTLDWGGMSQFDVHVRVASRLPVGAVATGWDVCMANLLGQAHSGAYADALRKSLKDHDRARFHWYGKAEAKPGRKMGHVNIVRSSGESIQDVVEVAKKVRSDFYSAWTD
jgi:5-(carboxyamino)imidazole ribonucleotide synthase